MAIGLLLLWLLQDSCDGHRVTIVKAWVTAGVLWHKGKDRIVFVVFVW